MIVIDSSVWIDFFNGKEAPHTSILRHLIDREPLLINDLIYTEVLQGFRHEKDFRKAKQLLNTLTFQSLGGKEMALLSAQNYRKLRKHGITVRKTIDVLIATFCITQHHLLLHHDKDFVPMEKHLGLKSLTMH